MRNLIAAAVFATSLIVSPVLAEEGAEVVVSKDVAQLPEPVRAKRDQLLAAAATGDILALKAIFDAEPAPPTVSFGDPEDSIAYLKRESRDGNGVEILSILANLLSAPYAVIDGGDGDPIYVWPSFAALDDLRVVEPADLVEAYRIAGYDIFEQMREVGGWIWWRVYIGPDGDLQAFVAGD